jgi:hypothetical protein
MISDKWLVLTSYYLKYNIILDFFIVFFHVFYFITYIQYICMHHTKML